MAEPTGDNLSLFWQAAAAAGVFVGGVVAALFGTRRKGDPAGDDTTAALRAQLNMQLLRRDLEEVFAAHRLAMENRLRQFEDSIHGKIDGLSEERRSAVSALETRLSKVEWDGARRDK
jgi:hypothetical protein